MIKIVPFIKQIAWLPIGFVALLFFVVLDSIIQRNVCRWDDIARENKWIAKYAYKAFFYSIFLIRKRRINKEKKHIYLCLCVLMEKILSYPNAKNYLSIIRAILMVFNNSDNEQKIFDQLPSTIYVDYSKKYPNYDDQMSAFGYNNWIGNSTFSKGFLNQGKITVVNSSLRHSLYDPGFEPFFSQCLSIGHLEVAQLLFQFQYPWSYKNAKTHWYVLPNCFLYLFGAIGSLESQGKGRLINLQHLFLDSVFQKYNTNAQNTLTSYQILNTPIILTPIAFSIVRSLFPVASSMPKEITLKLLFDIFRSSTFVQQYANKYDAEREWNLLEEKIGYSENINVKVTKNEKKKYI